MGCCLTSCMRLLFFTLWRAIFAALVALAFARIDGYIERTPHRDAMTGRAWRAYRRGKGAVRRGTPPDAGTIIDTEGKPKL
ncbi:MAG TPA: hypothetical protein VM070_06875 [Candidatus Saccharimonadales bacterium]|nr:hypothetical protein [Candidatus Saccharimonadales bacterium]